MFFGGLGGGGKQFKHNQKQHIEWAFKHSSYLQKVYTKILKPGWKWTQKPHNIHQIRAEVFALPRLSFLWPFAIIKQKSMLIKAQNWYTSATKESHIVTFSVQGRRIYHSPVQQQAKINPKKEEEEEAGKRATINS